MAVKWWVKKNSRLINCKSEKKEKIGSMWTGEAVKMLIAKVWGQQANAFADTDLRNISSIILNQEKYTAELIRMERNASANCLIIYLYLARRIWNVCASTLVQTMIRMDLENVSLRTVKTVLAFQVNITATADWLSMNTKLSLNLEKKGKQMGDPSILNGCKMAIWLEEWVDL